METIVPRVQEVAVKSVLTRSKLFPYCVNPYAGCSHGCVYCYANQDHALAERNRARHDPSHVGLAEAFIKTASG